MILKLFTLSLMPVNPMQFSLTEFRLYLAGKLGEYTTLHKDDASGFIYRYPVVQCKQIKNMFITLGISQGADFLFEHTRGLKEISGDHLHAQSLNGTPPSGMKSSGLAPCKPMSS